MGPLAGVGICKKGWPSGGQYANKRTSQFPGYKAAVQKEYIKDRVFFQKKDKPAQNHTQAHRGETLPADGAMPILNSASRLPSVPAGVQIQVQVEEVVFSND